MRSEPRSYLSGAMLRIGMVLVVGAMLCSCGGGGDGVVNNKTATVQGVVTSGAAAAVAISGATVTCAGKQDTTDAQGSFAILDVPEGSQTLTVTADGHETYTAAIHVDAPITTHNASMVPTVSTKTIRVTLFWAHSLSTTCDTLSGGEFRAKYRIESTSADESLYDLW